MCIRDSGKYAAFAYTAALNHLLADSDHVQHIGDTTVVCWAEGADDAYPGFFSAVIGGGTYGGLSDNDLRAALKRLANGLPCDDYAEEIVIPKSLHRVL